MDRVYGRHFVDAAARRGYDRADATVAWRYLVNTAKGVQYNTEAAMRDYLVKSKLRRVIQGGPRQFSRVARLWPLMSNAASPFIA